MKTMSREYLSSFGDHGIRVGSCIPSFCVRCQAQHMHSCMEAFWDKEADDFVYTFRCMSCMEKEKPGVGES